ncbi:MAG: hypothetical protein AB1420_15810 [Bacillota bacterium]
MTELPTKEQTKIIIAFKKASERCRGITGVEKGITKRAKCVEKEMKETIPEVKKWAEKHPEEFEIYHKEIGKHARGELHSL